MGSRESSNEGSNMKRAVSCVVSACVALVAVRVSGAEVDCGAMKAVFDPRGGLERFVSAKGIDFGETRLVRPATATVFVRATRRGATSGRRTSMSSSSSVARRWSRATRTRARMCRSAGAATTDTLWVRDSGKVCGASPSNDCR